jgi:hypothetical protein
MGFAPFGGFVFTIDGGNYLGTSKKGITDNTFQQIAKILNIPDEDIKQLMARHPRSVYVYSGTPKAPFNAVAGKGGGHGGGGGSDSDGGGSAS